MKSEAERIVEGMAPWYGERKRGGEMFPGMRAASVHERTRDQIILDSAVMDVAEFVRRRQNYSEKHIIGFRVGTTVSDLMTMLAKVHGTATVDEIECADESSEITTIEFHNETAST